MAGGLESEDDTTCGRPGNYIYSVFFETLGDKTAQLPGEMRVLQDAKLLPVYGRVKSDASRKWPSFMAPAVLNISRTLLSKLRLNQLAGHGLPANLSKLGVRVVLDQPQSARWPVDEPCLANDVISGHEPPVT